MTTHPLARRIPQHAELTAALSAATRAAATAAPIPPSPEAPHACTGHSDAVNERLLRLDATVASASVPTVPDTAASAADGRAPERARGPHAPSVK